MAWNVYASGGSQTDEATIEGWLKNAPPWRQRSGHPIGRVTPALSAESERRGKGYVSSGDDEAMRINVALMLRRPLLVTGRPGIGKTMLAYHLAWKLGLGEPLRWDIGSQTTLREGLYHYDAVGHLQSGSKDAQVQGGVSIGDFITLGPLGTALLPTARPRLLLVDEIDKAGFDLPHDLLHVFEEGAFTVPELIRTGGSVNVFPYDREGKRDVVTVTDGRVSTLHHPVVVITSNRERELPEAFMRRCVSVDLKRPADDVMREILKAQLGGGLDPKALEETLKNYDGQATDVLVQALFLRKSGVDDPKFGEVLKRESGA